MQNQLSFTQVPVCVTTSEQKKLGGDPEEGSLGGGGWGRQRWLAVHEERELPVLQGTAREGISS